jgi:hypothetical protein
MGWWVLGHLSAFVDTFPNQSECCFCCVNRAQRTRITPQRNGVGRVNLKHDVKAGTRKRSGRVNKLLSRNLYAVPAQQPAPTVAVSAQDSEIETNGAGMEALISVWWDLPPFCEDAQ